MKLNRILLACNYKNKVSNNFNFNIKGVSIHSEFVRDNYIFGAINGDKQNGEDFISDLLNIKNLVVILQK